MNTFMILLIFDFDSYLIGGYLTLLDFLAFSYFETSLDFLPSGDIADIFE